MGISTGWIDDSQVELLADFQGAWTWEDFHGCLDESARLFRASSHTISVVIDFSGSKGLPSGAPFAHAGRAFKMYESQPNFSGHIAVITKRPFTVMLARMMVATGMVRNLIIVSTRDEALRQIRARRAKNPPDGKSR